MNFLRRKPRPAESAAENETQNFVRREIEITVERTWTSVSVSAKKKPGAATGSLLPPGEETAL